MLQGAKKPLNLLENPVLPCITKGPSQFARWSGVNFKASPEDTLLQSRTNPQFADSLVLLESRDWNSQNQYGVSSYRSYVNKEFRPPIIPWECQHPISRMPRHETRVRVNPTAADNESGRLFVAQNDTPINIDKEISEYKTPGDLVAPTYYHPIDMPADNSVLPDLEMKLPRWCATSGMNSSIQIDGPIATPKLEYDRVSVPIETGFSTTLTANAPNAAENLKLNYTIPQIAVNAGSNVPYYTPSDVSSHTLVSSRPIGFSRPQVAVNAVSQPAYLYDPRQSGSETTIDLSYKTPQVAVNAGVSVPYHGEAARPTSTMELQLNRPSIAVSAGVNPTYTVDGQTNTDYLLNEKLQSQYTVVNPGSEVLNIGSNSDMATHQSQIGVLASNLPSYSYTVPSSVTVVDENERSSTNSTHRQYQAKRFANSLYHGGMCTAGAIPRAGLTTQPVRLRDAKKSVGLR